MIKKYHSAWFTQCNRCSGRVPHTHKQTYTQTPL